MAAGVKTRSADQADILDGLNMQARAAGRNGVLFIMFSTHGGMQDDVQYLLSENSVLQRRETAILESKIRDIASLSDAKQSLILIDACHSQIRGEGRSAASSLRAIPTLFGTAASFSRPMSEAKPQVVLSAAATGQYAYDDNERRNGVFTAAVIDGLQCGAGTDERGWVTIDTLANYVEQRILTWIHLHRNGNVTRATQLTVYGEVKPIALAECGRSTPAAPPQLHDP